MNPSQTLDEHRAAQAEALAHAGADERANFEARRREIELEKLLAAAEQRTQAERLAAEQAQARAANEAQVLGEGSTQHGPLGYQSAVTLSVADRL